MTTAGYTICRMCGKPYGLHWTAFEAVGRPTPRNGCGSLRAYFMPMAADVAMRTVPYPEYEAT
jgi:hypothetical protein